VKQVTQRPRDGVVSTIEVPRPVLDAGSVLVASFYSLLSIGTERTKLELGEKNLLQKARARPDLVRKVVERARAQGLKSTLDATRDRLAALAPMGYSAAGVVLEVGEDVDRLAPGDRVACGGEGANHAEVLAVPKNLVARIPDGVAFEDAAYTVVGSIALHGVRQAEVGIGEWVGIIGLGLVGQLAARIARAAGCQVVGIDVDPSAVELALKAGIRAYERDDPALVGGIASMTGRLGLDVVLLCASSASSDPLALAVEVARDRGRIVVVGETRIDVDRGPMYEKELELRMSRSYGPGRYEREYEERGRDLPAGYVRWTEQRNMQAFLELVAAGNVRPGELTTHRFPIDDAAKAYELLTEHERSPRTLGVLIEYPERVVAPVRKARVAPPVRRGAGIGLIGAGAFARATLIPALDSAGARLVAVSSESGLTAADVAKRFAFDRAATVEEVIADPGVDAVVIATRHSSHAALVVEALKAGKAVFVEKPLALSPEELAQVEDALDSNSLLMVGFNRRFAPLVQRLRAELEGGTDLVLTMRVNAGPLPDDHWLHDPADGGGRLLGEGCHFVDLLATLARAAPVSAHAVAVPQPGRPIAASDTFSAHFRFQDAVASLSYSGGGDPRMPKERLEVLGSGVSAVLDDFRKLEVWRRGKRREWRSTHDKGHLAEIAAFVAAVRGEADPPAIDSYLVSTRMTLALALSLHSGSTVDLAELASGEPVIES
jgi:predicted dehydrogenase/threonine dehydrogenase-like Zn-dependent dehydrogenase